MSIFTICFCGTDCWPDEGLRDRSTGGGSNPIAYGPVGYLPAKIYSEIQDSRFRKAIVPGPGAPWDYYRERNSLWVPNTALAPTATLDMMLGLSMWDLAGHGAAQAVGVPSIGRKKPSLLDGEDQHLKLLCDVAQESLGANLHIDSVAKPPSHDRYQFSTELLEVLLSSQHVSSQLGPITKINLIGHSRGAVAAIICSHELSALFPKAEISIFAIDPVPGPGLLSTEMVELGSRVVNYVGVYALDETSGGFNGLVPWPMYQGQRIDPLKRIANRSAQIDVPRYHLIYAPGRHGTVSGKTTRLGNEALNDLSTQVGLIGVLVDELARACLRRWGTRIEPSAYQGKPSLDDLRRAMLLNSDAYRAMRAETYTGPVPLPYYLEHGITSSDGIDLTDWRYLEDAIGLDPLVPRRGPGDPLRLTGPGQVAWQRIESLKPEVFTGLGTELDTQFPDTDPPR